MKNAQNQELEKFVDVDRMEFKLFLNLANVPCVRVRDLDAGENVSIVRYPSLEAAKKAYDELVRKVTIINDILYSDH